MQPTAKGFFNILILLIFSGCSSSAIVPTVNPTPQQSITPTSIPTVPTSTPQPPPTLTPLPTSTPSYPPEGVGPTHFPAGYDPLTGEKVTDPILLERLPMIVKVVNIPRYTRPQYGLSLADHVFEYYTEEGSTRFSAVYYGRDAEKVGGIRSARYFDISLIQMYKAIFAFGRADEEIIQKLYRKDFANRLVIELPNNCPPICRFAPNGQNMLVADTRELNPYIAKKGVDTSRPNLDGLFFEEKPPAGGQSISQVFVRYSGAIYNRWDYDPNSGTYMRWSDDKNDVNHTHEVYKQLTDALTGNPIQADNVVILLLRHVYQSLPGITVSIDMTFLGEGTAYAMRNGQLYSIRWNRSDKRSMVELVMADGSPYPLKPGNTWFEVIGESSAVQSGEDMIRFEFAIP